MDITDREVESLKHMLKTFESQVPDEKSANRHFYLMLVMVRRIMRIFVEKRNKKAEELLTDLLSHENESIRFSALSALWDAENTEIELDPRTHIKLIQFRNNPINQGISDIVYSSLKAEKAPWN